MPLPAKIRAGRHSRYSVAFWIAKDPILPVYMHGAIFAASLTSGEIERIKARLGKARPRKGYDWTREYCCSRAGVAAKRR